jgi:hypothetical protein
MKFDVLLERYKDYSHVESLPTILSDGTVLPPSGIWFSRTIKIRNSSNNSISLISELISMEQFVSEVYGT